FLQAVARDGALAGLAALVPRFLGLDAERGIVINELVAGGRSLQEGLGSEPAFPPTWATALGTALGTFHRLGRNAQPALPAGLLPEQLPWILSATGMSLVGGVPGVSGGGQRLLSALQSFLDFAGPFARLAAGWRRETVIHGDLKWDNLLLTETPSAPTRVHLVDWELVDWGDPAWDVGSVLQAFLLTWLVGLPPGAAHDPHAMARLAPLQPAIRAFWAAYRGAGPTVGESDFERAVTYGAARLVHSTYEHLQFSTGLTPMAVHALQLAAHLLAAPARARREVFGC
ncbi:MAG: phosphotransferase, partial [Thermoanaerobaculia bacterium]|nr:phosphotransferase [Thermoanaerobaculia bacterium]